MSKPKALLVAEKKSVADDIKNVYNKISSSYPYQLDIAYCSGHLIGLCTPDEYDDKDWKEWKQEELPLVPDTWKKKIIKQNYYNTLYELYRDGHYDLVINAGDAGREGQLIQMWTYEQMGVTCPILRYWADDTTAKTIEKALNNLRPNEEYQGLTDASILRAYLDWLCGMNYSRAASISLDRISILGRVMTPTLAMIVKRYFEIKNFSPEDFYELEAEFECSEGKYKGVLLNPTPNEKNAYRFDDRSVLEAVKVSNGIISSVEQEEKLHYAPYLYNLTDLQKDCSRKFGLSPKKTLDIAESLYMKHLLSYPRTESRCLASAQKDDIFDILSALSSVSEFSSITPKISDADINRAMMSKKYCDDKKVADHPALTPTTEKPDLSSLTDMEKEIYKLVALRFLAVFFPPKKTLTTIILTNCDERIFKTTGTVILDKGYTAILQEKNTTDDVLPNVSENTEVTVSNLNILDKRTTPPKPYNNAIILVAMETAGKTLNDEELEKVLKECAGLGTPATRAEILEKLSTDGYVVNEQGNLIPTQVGIDLINALEGQQIISVELTANWEKILKGVESGSYPFEIVYQKMVEGISKNTQNLLTLKKLGAIPKKPICKCPKCGRNVYESKKAYYCEGFLDEESTCEFRASKSVGGAMITAKMFADLCAGKPTKELSFHWKDNKKSTGKLYLKDDGNYSFYKDIVGKCPKCGRNVISAKKGFYCEGVLKSNEKVCDFSMYNKIGNTKIPNGVAAQVFANGISDKAITVKFASGKSNKGRIIINPDNSSFFSLQVDKKAEEFVCDCPYCKDGKIMHVGKIFRCSNYAENNPDACDFKIFDKCFEASIKDLVLTRLVNGEIAPVSFTSKDGQYKYNKNVTLDYNEEKERYEYIVEKTKQ